MPLKCILTSIRCFIPVMRWDMAVRASLQKLNYMFSFILALLPLTTSDSFYFPFPVHWYPSGGISHQTLEFWITYSQSCKLAWTDFLPGCLRFLRNRINLTCFTVSQILTQCLQSLVHKEKPWDSQHEDGSGYFCPDTVETPPWKWGLLEKVSQGT